MSGVVQRSSSRQPTLRSDHKGFARPTPPDRTIDRGHHGDGPEDIVSAITWSAIDRRAPPIGTDEIERGIEQDELLVVYQPQRGWS